MSGEAAKSPRSVSEEEASGSRGSSFSLGRQAQGTGGWLAGRLLREQR